MKVETIKYGVAVIHTRVVSWMKREECLDSSSTSTGVLITYISFHILCFQTCSSVDGDASLNVKVDRLAVTKPVAKLAEEPSCSVAYQHLFSALRICLSRPCTDLKMGQKAFDTTTIRGVRSKTCTAITEWYLNVNVCWCLVGHCLTKFPLQPGDTLKELDRSYPRPLQIHS